MDRTVCPTTTVTTSYTKRSRTIKLNLVSDEINYQIAVPRYTNQDTSLFRVRLSKVKPQLVVP